jgi:ElaB/YqjD/DUF883 family membrane-anchored ribosome-binding protein
MSNGYNPDSTSTFKKDIEGLGHQAGVIRKDVSTFAHDAMGAARDGAGELKDGARHAVDTAKDKLNAASDVAKHKYEDAKDHAAEMTHSMKGYISEHPLSSLAIAASVGIIAGIVWGRSKS